MHPRNSDDDATTTAGLDELQSAISVPTTVPKISSRNKMLVIGFMTVACLAALSRPRHHKPSLEVVRHYPTGMDGDGSLEDETTGGDISEGESSVGGEDRPKGGNLVFTSAGDHTNLMDNWTGRNMNYDVYLAYYGDDDARFAMYKKAFRWVVRRKGSKIGNFHHLVYANGTDSSLLRKCDRVFLLDDDIMFDRGVEDINMMFRIVRKFKLAMASPSFDNRSHIMWDITEHDPEPNLLFKYSSVVEFNSVVITRKAITKTMQIYNTSIIGWGMPHLAVCANNDGSSQEANQRSYAIVHAVVAVNPEVRTKTKKRELMKLKEYYNRRQIWEDYAKKINCVPYVAKESYGSVHLPTT